VVATLMLLAFETDVKAYTNIGMELNTDSVSICPCNVISEVEVTISNYDDVTHTYYLSMDLPPEWSGLPGPGKKIETATLSPGESIKQPVYITPVCYAKPGVYTVRITTSVNSEKVSKDLKVEILPCHFVDIVTEESIHVCKGFSTSLSMTLKNYGKISENFEIKATSSWGEELFKTEISLDSQETKSFEFSVTPPETPGNYYVTFSVQSKDVFFNKNEKEMQLTVDNCYDFDVDIQPKEDKVCLGKSVKYSLIITNVGIKNDSYNIYTPDWVTPESDIIDLEPNEEKEVDVFAEPNMLGKTSFNISVSSVNYPTLKKEVSGSLNALECRSVAVIIYPTKQTICQGLTTEYDIIVKNTGSIQENFDIRTSVGVLGMNKVALNPGESQRINLTIDTSVFEPGTENEITVEARADEISDSNTVELIAENCYSANLTVEPTKVKVCQGDNIVYEIFLLNTGKFKDDYTLFEGESVIDNVSLDVGEDIKIYRGLQAFIPSNQTFVVPIRALSKNVFLEKEMNITVEPLSECFSIEISGKNVTELKTDVCMGATVTLSLNNTGKRKDSYILTLKAPDWVYLSTNTITLDPGEEKEFYVYVSPNFEVESGEYVITVDANSSYTGDQYTFFANVEKGKPPVENVTGIEEQPNITVNITLPTGLVTGIEPQTAKTILLAIIILIIIVILAVKFILLVK
jgi:uncharacterized membrane protein